MRVEIFSILHFFLKLQSRMVHSANHASDHTKNVRKYNLDEKTASTFDGFDISLKPIVT